MSYVEFVRGGEVIFQEAWSGPFTFRGPNAAPVVVAEGQSAVMGDVTIRVHSGAAPGGRPSSPILQRPIPKGSDITLARRNVTQAPSGASGTISAMMTPDVVESKISGAPVLKGFQIIKKLGEGGMGAVWLATQMSTHRQVAIKTMTTSRLTEEQLARFVLEIEVTAQLDHPNIGRLYESRLSEELCYYAMEYIDGQELEDWADNDGPSTRQWLTVMLSVCRAVQYAHQKGIIHRDLKPGNVMVATDGTPKVVDFGIAKLVQPEEQGQDDSKLTTDGEFVGTPAYMSPEQIKARPQDIDTRTDVYALGVMIYEQVVGEPPFGRFDSPMVLFMKVLHEEPRPPRSIKGSVDRDLEAVILKALARKAEERYATAGELADDLERYLNGEPVLAQPQTTWYVLKKKVAKNKGKVAGALVLLAGFLAYAIFSYAVILHERDVAEMARDQAKMAEAEAQRERDHAEARFMLGRDFAHSVIFGLDDKLSEGVTSARAQLISDTSTYLKALREEAGERPDLMLDIGESYLRVGEVQREQGDTAAAMKSYRDGNKILSDLLEGGELDEGRTDKARRSLARSYEYLGSGARASGDNDAAGEHYEDALKVLRPLMKAHPRDEEIREQLVDVNQDYGRLLMQRGEPKKAAARYDESLDLRRERLEEDPDDVGAIKSLASTHTSIGYLYLERGDLTQARRHHEESLELRQRLVDMAPKNLTNRRRLATGLIGMGLVEEAEGDLPESESHHRQAHEIYLAQVEADPKNDSRKRTLLWTYYYLGHVQLQAEAYDKGHALMKEALPLAHRLATGDPGNDRVQRQRARTLILAAELALDDGGVQDAAQRYNDARAITGPIVERSPDDLYTVELHGSALIGLGRVAGVSGNATEAKRWFDEGIEVLRGLVKAAPHDQHYRTVLGESLLHAGQWALGKREYGIAQGYLADATALFGDLLADAPRLHAARRGLALSLTSEGQNIVGMSRRARGQTRRDMLNKACGAYEEADKQIGALGARGERLPSVMRAAKVAEKGRKKTCR